MGRLDVENEISIHDRLRLLQGEHKRGVDAFRYESGHLIVPKTPGLGVELDPEKIAKYRVA